MMRLVAAMLAGPLLAMSAPGQGPGKALSLPSDEVKLPGSPFSAISSPDGNWVFVSLTSGAQPGIAVLHKDGTAWKVTRVVSIAASLAVLAVTHDGKTVLCAADDRILAFDVGALEDKEANPARGTISVKRVGAVYVAISPDDKLAFVSFEHTEQVGVIDLGRLGKEGLTDADLVGRIPVGVAPVGLAFSPDGKFLYSTSEMAPKEYGWPDEFALEGRAGSSKSPAGVLAVIDVGKARTDPAHAVTRKVRGGDSPVRLALSPDGSTAYVTARGSNTVGKFRTSDLSLLASIKVGAAPVGIALSKDGRYAFVANSNRFAGEKALSTVSVIDTATSMEIDRIPAGAFPRELILSSDGKSLIITNCSSCTLQFVNISRLADPTALAHPGRSSPSSN